MAQTWTVRRERSHFILRPTSRGKLAHTSAFHPSHSTSLQSVPLSGNLTFEHTPIALLVRAPGAISQGLNGLLSKPLVSPPPFCQGLNFISPPGNGRF
jgi:hypothetical protein